MAKTNKKKKAVIKKDNLISNLLNHYGSNMNSSLVIVFFLLIFGVGLYFLADYIENNKKVGPDIVVNNKKDASNVNYNFSSEIAKFKSAEEFKDYLIESSRMMGSGYYGSAPMMMERNSAGALDDFGTSELSDLKTYSAPSIAQDVDRYSETNVQVAGIDEPDIIKTDGKNIFYSRQGNYYIDSVSSERWKQSKSEIDIIQSWPFSDMKLLSTIDKSGQLLVKNNTLVVFSGGEINGYDISNKEKAEKKWTLKSDSNRYNYFGQARLYKDKIYLVTQTYIDYNEPCPIRPLTLNDQKISIDCSEIYHPISPVPADSTYTVMVLDLASGEVKNKTSFVASQSQSMLYMSDENIYLSYPQDVDMFTFYSDFISKELTDLISQIYLDKINKLKSYEISNSTKMAELGVILENWQRSLGKDESLRVETEMQNRFENYYKNNKRSLANSGIVKISVDDLKIVATGGVPGYLLNQFSMDEYQGNLRVATTLGGMWGSAFSSSSDSANDLYVLDKNLKIIGQVLDMGQGERIYSTRFIEDKGYMVTFRQTDPFYVFDLSDPKNPMKKGELKIPGYSSYLHPIDKNTIIGIGEEDGKVKISLFDVSNPNDPKELYKYSLNEYWSEVNSNHRAFLMDAKYKVFFLPASKGGYVLSYADNKLSLVKAAEMSQAKRAIFINDYLYIVGNQQIKIFNEKNWEEVKSFDYSTTAD